MPPNMNLPTCFISINRNQPKGEGSWGPTVCMSLYDNVIQFPQFISKSKSYIVFTILDAFLGRNWRKKAFWVILGPKLGLFRTVGPNYVYAVV